MGLAVSDGEIQNPPVGDPDYELLLPPRKPVEWNQRPVRLCPYQRYEKACFPAKRGGSMKLSCLHVSYEVPTYMDVRLKRSKAKKSTGRQLSLAKMFHQDIRLKLRKKKEKEVVASRKNEYKLGNNNREKGKRGQGFLKIPRKYSPKRNPCKTPLGEKIK